jgi:hypothetical protein
MLGQRVKRTPSLRYTTGYILLNTKEIFPFVRNKLMTDNQIQSSDMQIIARLVKTRIVQLRTNLQLI